MNSYGVIHAELEILKVQKKPTWDILTVEKLAKQHLCMPPAELMFVLPGGYIFNSVSKQEKNWKSLSHCILCHIQATFLHRKMNFLRLSEKSEYNRVNQKYS